MKNAFKKLINILGVIFGVFMLLVIGIIIFAPREQPVQPKKEITPEMQAQYEKNIAAQMEAKQQRLKTERAAAIEYQANEKVRLIAASKARAEKAKMEAEVNAFMATVNGTKNGMIKHIKERMNNPDSFVLVNTRAEPNYKGEQGLICVAIQYRGTNGFGAIVTNYLFATTTKESKTFNIIEP